MHSPRARTRKQRGVATIEFAICAPLLLFMMLATAELGRAIFQYNTLVKAVRDGARYLATNAGHGSTRVVTLDTARINEAKNLVVTGNIAGTGTPLLPGLTALAVDARNAGDGFVSLTASYTYRPMLGSRLPTFGSGAPINLSMTFPATVVMRALP